MADKNRDVEAEFTLGEHVYKCKVSSFTMKSVSFFPEPGHVNVRRDHDRGWREVAYADGTMDIYYDGTTQEEWPAD